MKLRRSMLFVPGDNAAMLSTVFVHRPDSIMFDLEDAVSPSQKDSARLLVYQALRHPAYRDFEIVVRINGLDTEFGLKDLEAAVRGGAHIVRLPKTENPEDIQSEFTMLIPAGSPIRRNANADEPGMKSQSCAATLRLRR